MRVLIAPDKFKGTLTALEATEAMAKGVRKALPAAEIHMRPIADGGEGTVEALLTALGGRVRQVQVSHPLGGRLSAPIAILEDGTIAIEMASASGLALVEVNDPLAASSFGTGEMIAQALGIAPEARLIVGIGGSATTDGGTGAARACGWRFLDSRGEELPAGGGSLSDLARIDPDGAIEGPARIVGAADVSSPLTGKKGAARVYGAQKGASPEQVARLEEGLEVLAARIRSDLGVDVASVPGGGAGGGLGAGLVAFFGAELVSGFEGLAQVSGLSALVNEVDLVVTGEGRLDDQSLQGKAPIGLARLARRSRTKCIAVAGQIGLAHSELKKSGISAALSLRDHPEGRWLTIDQGLAVAEATELLIRRIVERGSARPRSRGGLFEGFLGARRRSV